MENSNEEEKRAIERMRTAMRCLQLRFKLACDEINRAITAFGHLKDTCDKHEIRKLPEDDSSS